MKTELIKATIVFLMFTSLLGCGKSEEIEPDLSLDRQQKRQAYVMAHDHLLANIDNLTAICNSFWASDENLLSFSFDTSSAESIDEVVSELPAEIVAPLKEYVSNAEFCYGDSVRIEFYNLEYWRIYEDELRNCLLNPGFLPLLDSPDRIITILEHFPDANMYGDITIGRASMVSKTSSVTMNFIYVGSDDESTSNLFDGHWSFYGTTYEMWGL